MGDSMFHFETKPIEKVKNDIHMINKNLTQIKMDLITMKADISIIKDYINQQKKKEEEISKGWALSW